MGRWILGEKFPQLVRRTPSVRSDRAQRKSQRHFAIFVVMPVGLSVGRNVYKLRSVLAVPKATQKPLRQLVALV